VPPSTLLLIAASPTLKGSLPHEKIGFLSFGHWTPSPPSQTRSAADALLQSIDLAQAAEELGADGPTFVSIILPASSPRRFLCWQPSAPKPAASRSEQP